MLELTDEVLSMRPPADDEEKGAYLVCASWSMRVSMWFFMSSRTFKVSSFCMRVYLLELMFIDVVPFLGT